MAKKTFSLLTKDPDLYVNIGDFLIIEGVRYIVRHLANSNNGRFLFYDNEYISIELINGYATACDGIIIGEISPENETQTRKNTQEFWIYRWSDKFLPIKRVFWRYDSQDDLAFFDHKTSEFILEHVEQPRQFQRPWTTKGITKPKLMAYLTVVLGPLNQETILKYCAFLEGKPWRPNSNIEYFANKPGSVIHKQVLIPSSSRGSKKVYVPGVVGLMNAAEVIGKIGREPALLAQQHA